MSHEHTIGFFLPNNATPAQIGNVKDSIDRYFGIQSAPGVDPATAVAQQNTTQATITGTTGIVLDSTGLPWDERIHSSAKSQTGKGVWTKRKGVDDATFNAVSAQLRATMAATGTTAPAPTLPQPGVAPQLPNAPQLPVVGQAGPVLPQLPPTGPSAFQLFTQFIGSNTFDATSNPTGRLTAEWVDAVIAQNGVQGGIANLAAREDLIPAIESQIKAALGL